MYNAIKKLSAKEFISEFLPAGIVSIFIAESFYKFGSFTLECLLFLSTFYISGLCINKLKLYFKQK